MKLTIMLCTFLWTLFYFIPFFLIGNRGASGKTGKGLTGGDEGMSLQTERDMGQIMPRLFDNDSRNHIILYLPKIIIYMYTHTHLKEACPLWLMMVPLSQKNHRLFKTPVPTPRNLLLDDCSG